MLFVTPPLSRKVLADLRELDARRAELGAQVGVARPWSGALRRQVRAATAESSIAIEGFQVPTGLAGGILDGQQVPVVGEQDAAALAAYARAMDHVAAMAEDPRFAWGERVILDLHFDTCHFQPDARPGRYREGPILVTSPEGGAPAYVAPPADEVPALVEEFVRWLSGEADEAHVVVRAAMAHLHLVSIHPFRDGNGRTSRIVQSLALARDGLVAPEFGSIEEYLARHTPAYYAALRKVQGGSYQPARDAGPWVRFCIAAHLEQVNQRLDQLADAGRRWTRLEELVAERAWPERLVIALEQCLFGGTDRASYAAEADTSAATASTDFRRLLDAGLVEQRGKGPATRYTASPALRTLVS
ncbi:Fic family protein [Paraconexibacter antarcticus]|uniref:Fic family protein n=1 Tax=Paraconexibacter antarcticus TaxID=2949664 RepID=A0ABY5DWD9_9ACTN|nr:Fic family protein [Paraconexibacter antarcticus]UTI65177.1 Fic family protein [Paraconexibacter antarcticus]